MTEELALEQGVVEHCAIECNERALATAVGDMDRLGDELLARARFSLNQDGRTQRTDLLDQVEDPPHLRAFGHHGVKAVVAAKLSAQVLQLVHEPAPLERSFHQETQVVGFIRLREIIVGAGFHGTQGVGRVAVGGEHDDSHRHLFLAQAREQLEAAHIGHAQIGDHEVKRLGAKSLQSHPSVARRLDLVVLDFQYLAQVVAIELHVVDHQDSPCHDFLPSFEE